MEIDLIRELDKWIRQEIDKILLEHLRDEAETEDYLRHLRGEEREFF